MAIYRYIPYDNKVLDIRKREVVEHGKRDEESLKDALIKNALVMMHHHSLRYTTNSLWLKTFMEEHNKKIRTKPLDKIMNVVNLWLFLK